MNGTFEFSQWATLTPAEGWRFAVGRFTGGDRDDVVGYQQGDGTIWVGSNTSGAFAMSLWATVDPAEGWQLHAGEFTRDRATDILVYHPSTGSIEVGRNTGNGFEFEQWAFVVPAAGWSFAVGHFRGGPRADVVGYHPDDGTVWVGTNTGTSFTFEQWGTVAPTSGWSIAAGDFTGNGRADVMGYHPVNGSIWVGRNHGSGFTFNQWAALLPAEDWTFAPGQLLTNGRSDLVGYHPSDGGVWVLANVGDAFAPQQWANVTPPTSWSFLPGRFTDDPLTDVVGYHADDGELWVGKFRYLGVEGYCWPLSAAPGEQIDFHLSSDGIVDVTYLRHVADANGVRSDQVASGQAEPGVQPTPNLAWRDGCDWPSSLQVTIADEWGSGMYSAKCDNDNGNTAYVTFIVKPRADRRSELAILANVNTWLAYNGWGGSSKYSGRARVSFLRPCPPASPIGTGFENMHLARAELWILGWLTDEGYRPDVYTDIDFDNGIDMTSYRCLVIGTHPEYWTTRMYDRLVNYLKSGGSLLYLGGNGIFEVGAYTDRQTRMRFLQGVEFGDRTPAIFRRQTRPRPERTVLGVTTERCAVDGSPYEVLLAEHPIFAGTGMSNGELFGDLGLNTGFGNGKASAWEVDTVDGPGAEGLPVDCSFESGLSPSSALPDGLEVLARGTPDPAGRGADMTFYRHPGGGIVLSAGSLTFGGSLVVSPAIQQIVRNAIAATGLTI